MATCSVTTNTTNYIRIHLILIKGGTLLTKTLFLKRVKDLSPKFTSLGHVLTVDEFLNKNRNQILSTQTGSNNTSKIYPQSGATKLDDWDLNLYCFILERVCDLPTINKLDMGLLKTMRNEIAHIHEPSLTDADFNIRLSKIKPIFSRSLQIINDPMFDEEITTFLQRCETGALALDEVAKLLHISSRSLQEIVSNQETILQNQNEQKAQMQTALSMLKKIDEKILPGSNVNTAVPDARVIIEVKNCTRDKEQELLEFLVKQFNETISKPECSLNKEFPNLAMHTISQAILDTFQSFLRKGRHVLKVENKCISLTIKCNSISSFVGLISDCIDGSLLDQLKSLIDAVRSWDGCEDVEFDATFSPNEVTGAILSIAKSLDEQILDRNQEDVTHLTQELSATSVDDSTLAEDSYLSCSTDNILRLTCIVKPETSDQQTEIEKLFQAGVVSEKIGKIQHELQNDPNFQNVEIEANLSESPFGISLRTDAEQKQPISKFGLGKSKDEIFQYLNRWKVKPLNIAVTGSTGSGKSSLINTLMSLNTEYEGPGLEAEYNTETKVRLVETKMHFTSYPHPENKNIVFWDIPRLRWSFCSTEEYLEQIQVDRYDVVLILFYGMRDMEDDLRLAKKIKQLYNKRVCFVRTHIDSDIQYKRKKEGSEKIDEKIEFQNLKERILLQSCLNLDQFDMFFMSNLQPDKYDFALLLKYIFSISEEKP